MNLHQPRDPDFASKVRDSFARQRVMATLGATLSVVEPGRVVIELRHRDDLTQQHGYVHAGIIGTIADSAGGYAAFSLMPPGSSVLTVEYKINLLAPAAAPRFRAEGTVVRSGRTITVAEMAVFGIDDDGETLCARGQQTILCLHDTVDGR